MKVRATLFACVLALTAAFWWRTGTFDFVDIDDAEYVLENAPVSGGLTRENVRWALTNVGYAANWHPLCWLSLMADATVAGRIAASGDGKRDAMSRVMHLHNVALHALSAGLLFLFLCLAVRRTGGAARAEGYESAVLALVALTWAVHPLRCEAVCWVSERKEVLSVALMLLSLTAYFRKERPGARDLAAAFLFGALAVAAKPVAVTLPVVVFLGDLASSGRPRWRPLAVFCAEAGVCMALTAVAQQEAMPGRAIAPYLLRVTNAVSSYGTYLVQTLVPDSLAAFYPFPGTIRPGPFAAGLIVLLAASGLAVAWALRRCRGWGGVLWGAGWYVIGLVPMIGLVQVGSQAHADRYTYWVGCGLSLGVACAVLRLADGCRRNGWAAVCVLAALTVGYGAAGARQMPAWRDGRSLYEAAYAANRSAMAAYYLGESVILTDRERAEALFRESVAKRPVWESHAALSILLATKADAKDLDEAYWHAQRAQALKPGDATSLEAFGVVEFRKGAYGAAAGHLRQALDSGSRNPVIRDMLRQALRRAREDAGPVRR